MTDSENYTNPEISGMSEAIRKKNFTFYRLTTADKSSLVFGYPKLEKIFEDEMPLILEDGKNGKDKQSLYLLGKVNLLLTKKYGNLTGNVGMIGDLQYQVELQKQIEGKGFKLERIINNN